MGQIADLLVGDSLALEVQCSRLSQQRLREDMWPITKQVTKCWLLGEELWLNGRLTDLQRDFQPLRIKIDFHLWGLDWKREEIRLKYLIL